MRLLLSPRAGGRAGRDAPHWRELAACDGEDIEIFFPIGVAGPAVWQASQAKAICEGCPVREECLSYALWTGQDHGIWGGLTAGERRALRRRDARGA